MPRKKRPLERTEGQLRDTSLIVVACEDTHAVKQYCARFRARRTQFKVLHTEDGRSSPGAVIERLDRYRKEYAQEEGDELWICIDADHWIRGKHQRELSRVLQRCRQKGYGIAVSNPCFEVWLLLHFTDIDNAVLRRVLELESDEEIEPQDLQKLRCEKFVTELRQFAGSYSKSRVNELPLTAPQVHRAVERARACDTATGDIPDPPGTSVYRLIETLQRRDSINLEG